MVTRKQIIKSINKTKDLIRMAQYAQDIETEKRLRGELRSLEQQLKYILW